MPNVDSIAEDRGNPQNDAACSEGHAANVAHHIQLAAGILTHTEHSQGVREAVIGRDDQAERGEGFPNPMNSSMFRSLSLAVFFCSRCKSRPKLLGPDGNLKSRENSPKTYRPCSCGIPLPRYTNPPMTEWMGERVYWAKKADGYQDDENGSRHAAKPGIYSCYLYVHGFRPYLYL